jgi:hypothetical protein
MNAATGPRLEVTLRAYLTACRRFRTERDAEGLLTLLVALADPELRLHRFGEHLAARSTDEAAWVLAYVHEKVARGDGRAQRAAVGLLDKGRLARVFPTEQLCAVAERLRERGHAGAALFGHDPARATTDDEVVPRPTEPVGYRISLARRALTGALERLLLDPDPRVVRVLLGNPRLTEADVVKLASSRRANAEVLDTVAQDDRWIVRYRVKVALANNPGTPTRVVLSLLPYLMRQDLREVSGSATRPEVRDHAASLMALRGGW